MGAVASLRERTPEQLIGDIVKLIAEAPDTSICEKAKVRRQELEAYDEAVTARWIDLADEGEPMQGDGLH